MQVAGHCARLRALKLRHDARARLEHLRTPRMERTSTWNVQRTWHLALKRRLLLSPGHKLGCGLKQNLSIRVHRRAEKLHSRGALDNFTKVHHTDIVTQIPHHAERVSYTVRRGLREAKGSWKTICTDRRKAFKSSPFKS